MPALIFNFTALFLINLFLHSAGQMLVMRSTVWINNPHYLKDFEYKIDTDKTISDGKNIFISCCNKRIAEKLSRKNFEAIRVGKEAILNLNNDHFTGTRLKESIRAGQRCGKMKEYSYCRETEEKLEEFKSACTHSAEPQIKHFFETELSDSGSLFVFEDMQGKWLGALMLREASGKIVKTELLLRKKDTPNGVMEALIYEVFSELRREGFEYWSLGEVPYVVYDSMFFSKEYWINFLGRRTKFAYNYYGLFRFKNKFKPDWNDVFICSKSRLNIVILFKILTESNLIILILYKALLIFSGFNN